jgi:ubiquinone/menaquinone biosynthesis C-methylase UbiE
MESLEGFEDDSFDRIFSFSAIRYCDSQEKALKAIHRILSPTGRIVIDFPNKYCAWHFFIKRLLNIKKHLNDRLFSKSELHEMFSAAGFKNIEIKYLLFTTRRLPVPLLPLFKIIDWTLERTPFIRTMAGVLMVKADKIV